MRSPFLLFKRPTVDISVLFLLLLSRNLCLLSNRWQGLTELLSSRSWVDPTVSCGNSKSSLRKSCISRFYTFKLELGVFLLLVSTANLCRLLNRRQGLTELLSRAGLALIQPFHVVTQKVAWGNHVSLVFIHSLRLELDVSTPLVFTANLCCLLNHWQGLTELPSRAGLALIQPFHVVTQKVAWGNHASLVFVHSLRLEHGAFILLVFTANLCRLLNRWQDLIELLSRAGLALIQPRHVVA